MNEPHQGGVPVVDDEQLRALPENEEEEKESWADSQTNFIFDYREY